MVFSILSNCNYSSPKQGSQILSYSDFDQSCDELHRIISNLHLAKRKVINKKRISNAKNFTFYAIAIPTAFLSLLLLGSDDDSDEELYILGRREVHINDLLDIRSCWPDAESEEIVW